MNMQVKPQHVMNVMDRTGHTTVTWNPDDPQAVEDAKKKFNEMIRQGYSAFAMNMISENGVKVEEKGRRISEFDPKAGKIMLVPQLRGG